MKRVITCKVLIGANVLLALAVLFGLQRQHQPDRQAMLANTNQQPSGPHRAAMTPADPKRTTNTAFGRIYSPDPRQFAANLRAIRCPEQTIIDILTAEVHRHFREKEEALRPTPADHVPFTWSARPTEPKLVERRQQAAALAREQAGLLRTALGCEVTVPIPLYAMTTSDIRFEAALAATPNLDACGIRAIHDDYWSKVQNLQQRTKGFWLPEDLEELAQLKAQRQQSLAGLGAELRR